MLPTLSRLSVRYRPGCRFRHRRSSRYLRISPLHLEFHIPLLSSSTAVRRAVPGLSPGISHAACHTAYTPFMPSESEQRLPPSYYRSCWHEVSCGFLWVLCQQPWVLATAAFINPDRSLQPEGLLPPRGVAPSDFRPLRKILDCSLPQESGQCLSASVAGQPLSPATRLCLGAPLPHQQADRTRAPPLPVGPEGSPPLLRVTVATRRPPGITHRFQWLSQCRGQIARALLTLSPLY